MRTGWDELGAFWQLVTWIWNWVACSCFFFRFFSLSLTAFRERLDQLRFIRYQNSCHSIHGEWIPPATAMGVSSQEEWKDIQCAWLCFKRKAKSERRECCLCLSMCLHHVCVMLSPPSFPSLMSLLAWFILWHNSGSATDPSAILWLLISYTVPMATDYNHAYSLTYIWGLNYIIGQKFTEAHKILGVQSESGGGRVQEGRNRSMNICELCHSFRHQHRVFFPIFWVINHKNIF